MDTEPVLPRRPGEFRNTPAHGIPAAKATPVEGTPIHPPPSAPSPHAPPPHAPPSRLAATYPAAPHPAAAPQARPGGAGPAADTGARTGAGTTQGAPIPPDAPTNPIVHASPGHQEPPQVWGRPPTSPQPPAPEPEPLPAESLPEPEVGPGLRGDAAWAGASEAQDPYVEPVGGPSSTTGPMGVRETSGVQVRLGSLERERERERERELRRRARQRAGRRSGLVAAGVLVLAGLVTIGLVLTGGPGDGDSGTAAGGRGQGGAGGPLPPAGAPVEVGTADGYKYRLATVTSGVSEGSVTTFHSTPPSGTSFPYIEYLLTNPTDEEVLLDFPGDVFVKRELVAPEARGRCMPQAGVPEDMCTPPTKSEVVRRMAGGALVDGDGGDKYMPPGSTYLVRATVDVPVESGVSRSDMGLYVWKQLYMADQLAKPVPYPD